VPDAQELEDLQRVPVLDLVEAMFGVAGPVIVAAAVRVGLIESAGFAKDRRASL
jgi:hypothetical protein